MSDVAYVSLEDLLEIVHRLDAQVRDLGLLASAVARPQTTVFGADAYPDVSTKAAAPMHSLCGNHALVDGNKRIAWVAMRLFLALNALTLDVTDDEAVAFTLGVADGSIDDVDRMAVWIGDHVRSR